jgi:hypothetical protein
MNHIGKTLPHMTLGCKNSKNAIDKNSGAQMYFIHYLLSNSTFQSIILFNKKGALRPLFTILVLIRMSGYMQS